MLTPDSIILCTTHLLDEVILTPSLDWLEKLFLIKICNDYIREIIEGEDAYEKIPTSGNILANLIENFGLKEDSILEKLRKLNKTDLITIKQMKNPDINDKDTYFYFELNLDIKKYMED